MDTSEPAHEAREPAGIASDWKRETRVLRQSILAASRRLMVFSAVAAGIFVATAYVAPSTYTSTLSFLPQGSSDAMRGNIASIAGQFGIAVPTGNQAESPHLYSELVRTEALLSPLVLDSFPGTDGRRPLFQWLQVEEADSARLVEESVRRLRESVVATNVAVRTSGLITVRVKTSDPRLSHALAGQLLDKLNDFNITTRQSQASAERRFTEQRLDAAKAELKNSEARLETFLRRNRQYQNSPELAFEQGRLQREVDVHQQVVTSLAQQYEEVRIREVRDVPVLSVIQPPTLPARADSRRLFLRAVLGGLIGVLVGTLTLLGPHAISFARSTQSA